MWLLLKQCKCSKIAYVGGPSPNFLAREIYNVVSRSFAIEELKDESLKETCVKVQMIYLKFQAIRETLFL